MLVVFAIEGRPPIDVAVGRTIALDVGADDVVVVAPDIADVVLTVNVDLATKSCEFEVTVVACVKPPTVMPKEPTADTDVGAETVDDAADTATLKCIGKT